MRLLLLIFIVIPIVEMWLLIQVGGLIGALPTIALVMLTAVIGLALLRRQGVFYLDAWPGKNGSGEIPAMEMIEALVLAVSGAMLLTPGFTDALGFAGLLPLSRHWLVNRLIGRMDIVDGYYQASHTRTHSIHGRGSVNQAFDNTGSEPGPSNGKQTLEGEYRRED